ncbi:MAG TPA: transcriptional regulator [Thermoplasmata archaeon]
MALPSLDPVIHQATRLRIMTLLFRNRTAAFTWARDTLGLTDGNLDTHATRLEEAGYILRGRVLTTAGFQVRLRITSEGDVAFRAYLEALRAYFLTEPVEPHVEGGVPPSAPS